jgi:hypothetical protein
MYKHGVFAEIMATKEFVPPKALGTLPVYFGTLPVHQLEGYRDKVNRPILVSSFKEAQTLVGYSNEWRDYTLCEAIEAHFRNNVQTIGPIVLINVLDPDVHVEESVSTAQVSLLKGVGYIYDRNLVLASVEIEGKTKGLDYTAQYISEGERVEIRDLNGSLLSEVAVSFMRVDPAAVQESDVIGGTSSLGERSGIAVVDLVYQTLNRVPTLLASPYWSTKPSVDAALKAASQKINGHWYAFINSDISSTQNGSDTLAKAKVAKVEEGYASALESPCWPMGKNGQGKLFHLSTLTTVTMQWVDFNNDGVPVETPSNKPIDIKELCLADETTIDFDQIQANELNSKGIRTAIYWGGRWVLWGSHTGEYEFGKDMDQKNIFDCSVRMLYYVANTFQSRYGTLVDKPFTRALKDTILNDMQEWLDNLMAQGRLLLANISFEESSNPTSDIVEGDFVFDIATTTTPPGKSLTAKIAYTAEGLDILFGGDQ